MDAVIYGFGPIGRLIAECCVKKGINVVGAVDINPNLIGKRLSDFGIDSSAEISSKLDFEGDVVFLSTGSFVDGIYPQIEDCIKRGFNIVSTCETLSYPYYRYPELSEKIDALAKEYGVTVLGSGINPGFLLDSLVVVLSASCTEVNQIRAIRKIDALKRREPFQKKIGIGKDKEEVERLLSDGRISGHVGYAESIMLLCTSMGVRPEKIEEGQKIVLSEGGKIEKGKVAGMIGWGSAFANGKEIIRIEFHAVAEAEEYEEVEIKGDNEIRWRSTGTKGDLGTASVIVNLSERVVAHEAGLITMADLIPFRPSFKV
ncbi:putative conserved protein related to dihydrodipicolinate reductase [Archaeoglobus sulfaticallidus PM70-1]|uniref:Putative conserved protein related to dihydrodipicolinate reductase n=1 Tax=Archaeoglobus sulfaticallidus PM70-1 TaxID=387631 RepID=N0BIK3_9EURY|nr:hypothetical protein [Archaeoglobus sulfaticallidus]AGK60301.1 putative conserved protein related to dihydrodipicolinate reductase [Archaeoglobus sulfaticallidus PM70-1]